MLELLNDEDLAKFEAKRDAEFGRVVELPRPLLDFQCTFRIVEEDASA